MRFIHMADIHFDAPFTALAAKKQLAEERRLEQRAAFKEVIKYIAEEKIPFLFIAGDLYEQKFIRESTIEYINNLFKTIPQTRIFISPGNHDPFLKNSFYNTFNWNNNVTIFNDNIKIIELEEVDIYGYGFTDFYCTNSKIEEIKIKNKNKINILIAHGSIDASKTLEMQYNPINSNKLEKIGFDYIALGHIHKRIYKNNNIIYPGSMISFGFDEQGEHGILDVKINKNNYLDNSEKNKINKNNNLEKNKINKNNYLNNLEKNKINKNNYLNNLEKNMINENNYLNNSEKNEINKNNYLNNLEKNEINKDNYLDNNKENTTIKENCQKDLEKQNALKKSCQKDFENQKIDFIKIDKKLFEEKKIDISNLNSEEELIEKIKELNLNENSYYKIILVGSKKIEINQNKLCELTNRKNVLKIYDESKIEYDIDNLVNQNTLKGIFLKVLLEKENLDTEERKRAIEIGLKSFE